jgi:hypothetical protein
LTPLTNKIIRFAIILAQTTIKKDIKTIIIGLISQIKETLTIDGIQETAPNSCRIGWDCKENTKPMINSVTATIIRKRFSK